VYATAGAAAALTVVAVTHTRQNQSSAGIPHGYDVECDAIAHVT